MHKDCIIITHNMPGTLFENIECTIEDIHALLKRLQGFHICKITYIIASHQQGLKEAILQSRSEYGFAVDFYEVSENNLSATIIQKALAFTDSEDVVILNATCKIKLNIDYLMTLQQRAAADCTIITSNTKQAYVKESYLGAMVLFKPSFLSLDFSDASLFEQHYLQDMQYWNHNCNALYYSINDNKME